MTLNSPKFFSSLTKLLCRLFHDDSESVRQSATREMVKMVQKVENPVVFAALIPSLETRLGAERIVEDCEELRLGQLII